MPLVGGHPVPCGFVCRLIGIAPRRLVLPSPPSSQLWQGRNFPPAGPESLTTVRRYVETIVELAAKLGDHELPAEYADWTFAEGFQQNIDALRAR